MPDIELTSAELDELERLAKAATPGPWELGECENRDDRGRFTSYSVEARPSWSPDWPKAVVDTLNSGIMEVQTEHDEDGSSSWDEQGRKDAAYIASANPATILRLLSLARAGLEAGKAEESMRERAASVIEKQIYDIVNEHGSYEPDTNYTNLPDWAETVCEELENSLKAIRALPLTGDKP